MPYTYTLLIPLYINIHLPLHINILIPKHVRLHTRARAHTLLLWGIWRASCNVASKVKCPTILNIVIIVVILRVHNITRFPYFLFLIQYVFCFELWQGKSNDQWDNILVNHTFNWRPKTINEYASQWLTSRKYAKEQPTNWHSVIQKKIIKMTMRICLHIWYVLRNRSFMI